MEKPPNPPEGPRELPLELVDPSGENDRIKFAPQRMLGLARSILLRGLQQPILVRPVDDRFRIVAGERRYRAHLLLTEKVRAGEWQETDKVRPGYIMAFVREMSDDEAEDLMAVENLDRENLTPMEEAWAYERRRARLEGLGQRVTAKDLADKYNRTESEVRTLLRLLKLVPEAQELVHHGQLPLKFAEVLSGLSHERQRVALQFLNRVGPTLERWRVYCADLAARESQQDMLLLTDIWIAQANDNRSGGWGKDAIYDGPVDLEHFPDLRRFPRIDKESLGMLIETYIELLRRDDLEREAAAVGTLYQQLVWMKKVRLASHTVGALSKNGKG